MALVFSVGYLSVGSLSVFASEVNRNSAIPLIADDYLAMTARDVGWDSVLWQGAGTFDSNTNTYSFSNPSQLYPAYIVFSSDNGFKDLHYAPDLFDYYFLITVYGDASSSSTFAFDPSGMYFEHKQCNVGWQEHHVQDLKVYHHDDYNSIGFTAFGSVPVMENTNIYGFCFIDDDGSSRIPSDVSLQGVFFAVPKNGVTGADIDAILTSIENLRISNWFDSANEQAILSQMNQDIQKKLEEQYDISEDEDFGVKDITASVEEKMGVLTFTSDTLVSFLDLFSAESSGGTQLTFPGFKLNMGNGQTYQVWPDYTYDLKELEQHFGFLINTVRTITVLCVWLALFKYLGKAYEHFINKR